MVFRVENLSILHTICILFSLFWRVLHCKGIGEVKGDLGSSSSLDKTALSNRKKFLLTKVISIGRSGQILFVDTQTNVCRDNLVKWKKQNVKSKQIRYTKVESLLKK